MKLGNCQCCGMLCVTAAALQKLFQRGIFCMPQQQILEISNRFQFSIRWVRFMKNIFSYSAESQLHNKSGSLFCAAGCAGQMALAVQLCITTQNRGLAGYKKKQENKKSVTRERSETCWNDLFKHFLPVSSCFSSFLQDMTAANRLM